LVYVLLILVRLLISDKIKVNCMLPVVSCIKSNVGGQQAEDITVV
jgi:hypothetical protein